MFHDLFGYILQMSPDLVALLDGFDGKTPAAEIIARTNFEAAEATEFVQIFTQYACLLPGDADAGNPEDDDAFWKMVPIKGKWNVWERGPEGRVTIVTAWGDRPVAEHALSVVETSIWDHIDGQTSLEGLSKALDKRQVRALIERLAHSDVQAVKLSHLPLAAYATRPGMMPPYLSSTMPYARYEGEALEPLPATISTTAYYQDLKDGAEAQFDHEETTLSHLFRRQHPALGGRTYGVALLDGLVARGLDLNRPAGEQLRILEVGAGLGYVAEAIINELKVRGCDVAYEILELSPALATVQRSRLANHRVMVRDGDCMKTSLPPDAYDLIIANEMIGDLPAIELNHAQIGLGDFTEEARARRLDALGEVGEILAKYELPIQDAPDPFYLNMGAIRLLPRIAAWLRPGGMAVATEFGELSRYPRISTHLDHPEQSIHFGHLIHVAKRLGLATAFEYVIDMIELDRSAQGLATTRSYYRALAAMLARHDIAIEKIGYTRSMWDDLVGNAIDPASFGDIHFDRIEDRLMGLVPHEFKALVMTKPA